MGKSGTNIVVCVRESAIAGKPGGRNRMLALSRRIECKENDIDKTIARKYAPLLDDDEHFRQACHRFEPKQTMRQTPNQIFLSKLSEEIERKHVHDVFVGVFDR